MDKQFFKRAAELGTAQVVDACLQLALDFIPAPRGLKPVVPDSHLAGRVLPVRHSGSAAVFLEALERAQPGDVIVVDNGGREDEACVGDLLAMEAQHAGLAGLLVWGCHRDSRDIARLGFPVFSYGTYVIGPRRLRRRIADPFNEARIGHSRVTRQHVVFADADGAVFFAYERVREVITVAREILAIERQQAKRLKAGASLRKQFRFDEYQKIHTEQPGYSFGQHLETLKRAALGEPGSPPGRKRS